MALPRHNPIQWRRGFKALGAILKDPDDTAQFARIVESFQGDSVYFLHLRMARSAEGKRLFREKPDLLSRLSDHEWLESLPENSLGRVYLDFCRREGITGQGLKEVIEEGYTKKLREKLTPEQRFTGEWMRDSHDLYHLVTGYQTDLIGELCVLSFTVAQTWNLGVLVPVSVAYILSGLRGTGVRSLVRHAVRRAREAVFFPAQDWTELLELPLDEVRRRLKVGDPPAYEPIYTVGRGPRATAAA